MKKILVIEDNKDILENTAEILELSNYKVITAPNGRIGIEQALEKKPDLILCDILMPDLDGYGVLHMVQKNPELEQTPFVFLTAKTEQGDVRKGMALGADDYVTKPFDPTDLLRTIESRLRKADLIRKRIAQGISGINEIHSFIAGEQVLKDFVDGRQVDHYKRRQRIFSEGNHPIRIYYVQKGKVKVFKINEEGKEFIMKIVNEKEFFGYIAMLEGTIYKENADAMEDSEIVTIPKNEFDELMHSNLQVSRKFITLLASDVSQKEEQLIHIAYNSLRKKVADALLLLKEKFADYPGAFNIHISRENLAAVAGTATESLIRTLTDFKAEKVIDIKDANITILNEEKLRRMIN